MIEISLEEMEVLVQDIRRINQSLTQTLYQLKNHMILLENSWQGDASLAFKDRIQSLDGKFDLYQQIVEKYATHLESIIDQYRLTEQNLHYNVSSFT